MNEEERAFALALAEALAATDVTDAETQRQTAAAVRDTVDALFSALLSLPVGAWAAGATAPIEGMIAHAFAHLRLRLALLLRAALPVAFGQGADLWRLPFAAAAIAVAHASDPAPLPVLQWFVASRLDDLLITQAGTLARGVAIGAINGRTRDDLLFAVRLGLRGPDDTAGGLYGATASLVRTEIAHAVALGAETQADTTADHVPGMRKEWRAVLDERTRPAHRALSGTTVGWDDHFTCAGTPCSGPHDPDLPPSQLINCRCTLVPIYPAS